MTRMQRYEDTQRDTMNTRLTFLQCAAFAWIYKIVTLLILIRFPKSESLLSSATLSLRRNQPYISFFYAKSSISHVSYIMDRAVVAARFDRMASTYEKHQGEACRQISRVILKDCLTTPLSGQSVVLDNAAGTGITATEILKVVPKTELPKEIHAIDISPAMIREVNKLNHTEITAAVMDCQDLKFEDNTFTHIFFQFIIWGIPDAVKGAKELYRTLRTGGSAYVTTCEHLCWVDTVNRAVQVVKPGAPEYKGPIDPVWHTSKKLRDVLEAGGFQASDINIIQVPIEAEPGYSGFMEGTLMMARGPMVLGQIARSWSDDDKARLNEEISKQFESEMAEGTPLPMPTWVAIATK